MPTSDGNMAQVFARCLDRNLFEQIRKPDISTELDMEDRASRAQVAAIGYAVARDPGLPRTGNVLWVIVNEDGHLWRWNVGNAENYEVLCEQIPWLAMLEQIFLTGE